MSRKILTEEEVQQAYDDWKNTGRTQQQIADELHVSLHTLTREFSARGMTTPKKRRRQLCLK